MIVIKIKTWKDYKKAFIEWVKEPRRSTCKEYVECMEALERATIYKVIAQTCDKHCNITVRQRQEIIDAVERCVGECAKQTKELIDAC